MTSRLPMTPGRWVALVIGTPLALVAIGWTALTAVAFAGLGSSRVNLAVPLHGRTAAVSVDEGDISVGPGPAGRLRVHGTVHYSLIRPKLTWERSGPTVALHARCQAPVGVCSFDYAVAVPPAARSVVSTAAVSVDEGDISVGPGPAGRLRVHGTMHYSLIRPKLTWERSGSTIALHARCQVPTGVCSFDYAVAVPPAARSVVSTASGNVTASRLTGTVTLSTDSGDIKATGISGHATISDQSGDITVNSPAGARVLIMNDSGDITGSGVSSRQLNAQDQSGDITVVFSKVPDLVRISDSSGNIKLVLPPGPTAYRVSASTSSGQTSIGVPQSPTSPHVISATDQSGDITISQ